ncbi:MAG: hypothetical protein MZW92_77920 [Comamonadaceae bacterium]|nr:hypothetical protein [Comamonadaceae bacterium]
MLQEEGLENAWARHQRHHQALKAGLEAMGLKYLVEEGARLPQMNAVHVPEAIDERGRGAPDACCIELQPRDRRRPRRPGRQDLAHRHHGLLLQAGERDAVPVAPSARCSTTWACRSTSATPRPQRTSAYAQMHAKAAQQKKTKVAA